MANVDRILISSTIGEGNEESKVREDGKLSTEENNAITELRAKLKENAFDEELTRCLEKTETSDEPEEDCPTSPGQGAKVSGPSIKVDETCSESLFKDMFGDVTGNLIGALTGAKFGRKYQTFFGWFTKYFKKFFPTSRPTLALKDRPESKKEWSPKEWKGVNRVPLRISTT